MLRKRLLAAGIEVLAIRSVYPSLEDIFVSLTRQLDQAGISLASRDLPTRASATAELGPGLEAQSPRTKVTRAQLHQLLENRPHIGFAQPDLDGEGIEGDGRRQRRIADLSTTQQARHDERASRATVARGAARGTSRGIARAASGVVSGGAGAGRRGRVPRPERRRRRARRLAWRFPHERLELAVRMPEPLADDVEHPKDDVDVVLHHDREHVATDEQQRRVVERLGGRAARRLASSDSSPKKSPGSSTATSFWAPSQVSVRLTLPRSTTNMSSPGSPCRKMIVPRVTCFASPRAGASPAAVMRRQPR